MDNLHLRTSWLLILLILIIQPGNLWGKSNSEDADKVYSIGVVPQKKKMTLYKNWNLIMKELTRVSGVRLSLRLSQNIPVFENEFKKGDFDFAYMNPYHALMAEEAVGYTPLIRDINKKLFGILVVKKNSTIKSPKDLNGQDIAFPAPNALAASLMIRAALTDEFNIKIKPYYVNTHSSVYLNVATGIMVAGGGVQKTLAQQSGDLKDNLKVLYRTISVTPHPFVAHPRVPLEIQNKIKKAFIQMNDSAKGRGLLGLIPIKEAGEASLKEYGSLKELRLERFVEE